MTININELARYESVEELDGFSGEMEYLFPVGVFLLADGKYGWRGVNQAVPSGAIYLGEVQILFVGDDDVTGDWPLGISPAAVVVPADLDHVFGEDWEIGDINWTANGMGRVCAAQFCRE